MNMDKRILPELRQAFEQFPGFQLEENLEWSRSLVSAPPVKKSEHVHTTSRMIPGAAGEMLAKIYEPAGRKDDKLPAMLWIHGGGYVMGHPDMDDELCERFVQTAGCVVVSVDYRLAPENPYPAAMDCYLDRGGGIAGKCRYAARCSTTVTSRHQAMRLRKIVQSGTERTTWRLGTCTWARRTMPAGYLPMRYRRERRTWQGCHQPIRV